MFAKCKSLISVPDISKWDMHSVTNMYGMFSKCKSLISLPDISKWDINNVKDMRGIFYNCESLISLPDFSKLDINETLQISKMFDNYTLLSPNSISIKKQLINKCFRKKKSFDISNKYIMIYKIPENEENIRIFGGYFVLNNSNEAMIIYKNQILPLKEEFETKDIKENTLKLEIIFSEDVIDLDGMFENCD